MFLNKRFIYICLLILALVAGLYWAMVGRGNSDNSSNHGVSQADSASSGVRASSTQASLFRVNIEVRSGGKVTSVKKIRMIVAPGVSEESSFRYPVKIQFENQAASGVADAERIPIYLDIFWHRDGHVSSFNWRGLAADHGARKPLHDLWWMLSSKLSGSGTLDIPVDSGIYKYKFSREDATSIVRKRFVLSNNDQTTETWKLVASDTSSPHRLMKVESLQNYTIPSLQGRAEQKFSVYASATREDYPVDAIDFTSEGNGLANAAWAKAKAAADDGIAQYIRLNGGIVNTFNKTAKGNKANIEPLGGYLIRKASDREILQALQDPNMNEDAKADLILALQLQEEERSEGLLLRLAKMSDTDPGNAFRAVIALGQRQTTSIQVMETLADLAHYKKASDASVANNALLQMAYLSRQDSSKYGSITDKTLSDYSKSPQMIPQLLLQAQTATTNPVYRDAAIAAIPEGGSFMGKPTDMHIMTSAAKLVGTQALLGDFKAINHIKENVLKVENEGILSYYTSAYAKLPIDSAIEAGIREKISPSQPVGVQAAYFQALSASPERCKHNEQFLRGAVAASGTNASIKQMLQQACRY